MVASAAGARQVGELMSAEMDSSPMPTESGSLLVLIAEGATTTGRCPVDWPLSEDEDREATSTMLR